MAVDDENFLAAVARHLVGGFLQQRQLQVAAVGDGSGLVARFGNLAEIIFGEDDGVFFLGGVQRGVTHIEQIGAQGQVRPVFFQNAEGQQASSLRTMNALAEVGGGQFFPVDGELDGGVTACAGASSQALTIVNARAKAKTGRVVGRVIIAKSPSARILARGGPY